MEEKPNSVLFRANISKSSLLDPGNTTTTTTKRGGEEAGSHWIDGEGEEGGG